MLRTLIAVYVLALVVASHAHDGHNDDWFRSLKNGMGGSCCDGSDYQRVEDPDWKMEDNAYWVRLGEWQKVPDDRIVSTKNIIGPAIVWPYIDMAGKERVRCFLPGSGA